jgi:hypothetical protein
LSANRPAAFKNIAVCSENQNMTTDEDRHRPSPGVTSTRIQRRRRRRVGEGFDQRFHAKHFLLGLSYGFALGFVLETILASHP